LYVTAGLVVVALNFQALPTALEQIVKYAFSPPGMIGGFAGSGFIYTLTWGVKRGIFSNEAGQGSAPIAHAAAKTDEPVREGSVAMMGPLVDTVVICFMTGLIIVVTGTWNKKYPDKVRFTSSSGITVLKAKAGVRINGKITAESLFQGTANVKNGNLVNAELVRNNAVIDDMKLTVAGRPLSGSIRVVNDNVGIFDQKGHKISNASCWIHGRMLLNGSPLTAASFQRGLAPLMPFGNYLVTIAVFLFVISTAISWSYYGDRAVKYLFGERAVLPYKILFTLVHFLGAIFSLELVWSFGDAALGMMAIPNLFVIIWFGSQVKRDSDDYFARMDKIKGKK